MFVRRALLTMRAAAFAAVCVASTAEAHGLEEGRTVGAAALAAGFAIVFVAALAAGRRERSRTAIILGVLVCQAVLHALLTAAEGPMAGMSGHGPVGMTLAHLAVAVVTGWWLRHGEAACWRLLRSAESAATAALLAVVAHLAGHVPGTDAERIRRSPLRLLDSPARRPVTSLLRDCASRRGPPVGLPVR
ncbi:MAG: hypothetical protein JWR81_4218 [Pseudonocardia sp.]|nr:hypothetical protein [Pseudonocardia sp.]